MQSGRAGPLQSSVSVTGQSSPCPCKAATPPPFQWPCRQHGSIRMRKYPGSILIINAHNEKRQLPLIVFN